MRENSRSALAKTSVSAPSAAARLETFTGGNGRAP